MTGGILHEYCCDGPLNIILFDYGMTLIRNGIVAFIWVSRIVCLYEATFYTRYFQ